MTTILGKYYRAISVNEFDWIIMRGQFEMGRYQGTPEEVARHLIDYWDSTVITDWSQNP